MQQPHVKFRDALLVWIKVGLMSFGGPTGHIALMHAQLVEQREWISEESFLRASLAAAFVGMCRWKWLLICVGLGGGALGLTYPFVSDDFWSV